MRQEVVPVSGRSHPPAGAGGASSTTNPDLEVVAVGTDESFKVWSHGYPYKTVRWHFHPEYELHLVTNTRGRAFVGDYIGSFGPGDLVLTGPNVPHNWLSDVPAGEVVPERGVVLQFCQGFADRCLGLFPELSGFGELLQQASRGVSFGAATARTAEPVLRKLLTAGGPTKVALFFELVDVLSRSGTRRLLASVRYQQDPLAFMARPMNHILEHIANNLDSELRESDLAQLTGCSASAFSRQFQRSTGVNFIRYVNEMRVNRACELLSQDELRITDICFEVGFNKVCNFNRRFRSLMNMSPREYRKLRRSNAEAGAVN